MADTTPDTADDGLHEIQLSGKHLVFLFMATTVVSVLIFICGVLVGRGVTSAGASGEAVATPARGAAPAADQASTQSGAAATEPPSPPAGDELSYRKRLESDGSPADDRIKTAAGAARDERPEPAAAKAPPPPAPAPAAPVKAAGASRATPAPASSQGPSGRPGRWVLQLVALRDRSAAASIVQRLSAKGYPAFIVNPSASGSGRVYKVQVGRYDDKNEAERVSRRLEKEEKFNPWISAAR